MSIKLNVGCGRNILDGWTNLDCADLPGIDIVADIDRCADAPLPIEDNSVEEFLLSHVIEHIRHPLPLMQELHRVAKPNATMIIRVPYGSSDDAFEDPTHVQQYFEGSFNYFSQPFYWRADYGYRGDWQPEIVQLIVDQQNNHDLTADQIMEKVKVLRNQVKEMIVKLVAIKPIREPKGELQQKPQTEIILS